MPLLTVVGALGTQGRGVVSWFQTHHPDWRLRGLTRDASSPAAEALAKTSVEVVQANLDDLASLQAAFKGSNYIYAYTDAGSLIGGAMEKFAKGEIAAPVGKETFRIEVQQGKNIADAAAGIPELERLVWSSLYNASELSGGKLKNVFHFDSKPAVFEYMLKAKGLENKVSELVLGAFVSNVVKMDLMKIKILDDGSALWNPPAYPAEGLVPWIDIEKDIGAFVNALIQAPAPTSLLGVGEWMTCLQWLELWGKHVGVQAVQFEELVTEEMAASDPSGLQFQFYETARLMSYGSKNDGTLTPEEFEKKGYPPIPRTGVLNHIQRTDWSGLLIGGAA